MHRRPRHHFVEWSVETVLESEMAHAFLSSSNAGMTATDTQKNAVRRIKRAGGKKKRHSESERAPAREKERSRPRSRACEGQLPSLSFFFAASLRNSSLLLSPLTSIPNQTKPNQTGLLRRQAAPGPDPSRRIRPTPRPLLPRHVPARFCS